MIFGLNYVILLAIIVFWFLSMCICPRVILNKGYNPLDPKTSQFIEVKCNLCIQCKSERQNSYAYRFQQEIFNDPTIMPFFVTFTYNSHYRPYLEYFDDAGKFFRISCWNRMHLVRFHKIIRRQLQYYYGIDKGAFKYLSCCERGSDREYFSDSGRYRVAQKVPHYHNLYAVKGAKDLVNIRPLPKRYFEWIKKNNRGCNFRSFFHWLLDDRWKYGMICDLEVTRSVASCTRYIAKYCTKNYNEDLLNVQLGKIFRLQDWDYVERRIIWNDKVKTNKFPKHAPAPIHFRSLLPRPSQSVNLGFSYDPDRLKQYINTLASGDLVTLVGSRKSSKMPLPYYYYKKICKWTYQVPIDDTYNTQIRQFDGLREHWVSPISIERTVEDWDNVNGYYTFKRLRSYTMSFFTRIGEYVRHKVYRNRLDTAVRQIKTICSNLPYFEGLLNSYNHLPDEIHDGFYFKYFDFDCVRNACSLVNFQNLRSRLKEYFHLPFNKPIKPYSDLYYIDVLLKTFSLCKITHSYLNHLKYQEIFKKGLLRKASDDPDLLIPQFISLVY